MPSGVVAPISGSSAGLHRAQVTNAIREVSHGVTVIATVEEEGERNMGALCWGMLLFDRGGQKNMGALRWIYSFLVSQMLLQGHVTGMHHLNLPSCNAQCSSWPKVTEVMMMSVMLCLCLPCRWHCARMVMARWAWGWRPSTRVCLSVLSRRTRRQP